jgi:hypothetical protein
MTACIALGPLRLTSAFFPILSQALDGPQQPSARTLASLYRDAVDTAIKAMRESTEAARKGDLLVYLVRHPSPLQHHLPRVVAPC